MNSFPHLRASTIFAKKYHFRIEIKTLPMRITYLPRILIGFIMMSKNNLLQKYCFLAIK